MFLNTITTLTLSTLTTLIDIINSTKEGNHLAHAIQIWHIKVLVRLTCTLANVKRNPLVGVQYLPVEHDTVQMREDAQYEIPEQVKIEEGVYEVLEQSTTSPNHARIRTYCFYHHVALIDL